MTHNHVVIPQVVRRAALQMPLPLKNTCSNAAFFLRHPASLFQKGGFPAVSCHLSSSARRLYHVHEQIRTPFHIEKRVPARAGAKLLVQLVEEIGTLT